MFLMADMCTVYLIHLETAIAHAKHYLGYTCLENVTARLARHKRGDGAKLLKRANELAINYKIVRTWDCNNPRTARALERKLKHLHNSPKLCPVCNTLIEH